jgi:hypothetical protein
MFLAHLPIRPIGERRLKSLLQMQLFPYGGGGAKWANQANLENISSIYM